MRAYRWLLLGDLLVVSVQGCGSDESSSNEDDRSGRLPRAGGAAGAAGKGGGAQTKEVEDWLCGCPCGVSGSSSGDAIYKVECPP